MALSDRANTYLRTSHCLSCTGSDKSGSVMWLWQFALVGKIPLAAGKRPGVWSLAAEVQEVGKQI